MPALLATAWGGCGFRPFCIWYGYIYIYMYICMYIYIYIFIYLSQKDMKTTNRISPRVHIGHGKVVGSNLFAYGMAK